MPDGQRVRGTVTRHFGPYVVGLIHDGRCLGEVLFDPEEIEVVDEDPELLEERALTEATFRKYGAHLDYGSKILGEEL